MPEYLNEVIALTKNTTYSLRSATNKDIASVNYKTNCGKKTFAYFTRIVWNAIPISIRKYSSLASFKHMYKDYLIKNQYIM